LSRLRPISLLETVGGLLERTYRLRSGLDELGRFVIGDAGYRALYGADAGAGVAGSAARGARTLVRETAEAVRVCVYFPDALIRALEAHPPQRGLGEENLDAFSTFVEEIDHLLVIAESARLFKPVSLFELELHANVSKHLVLARYLAGRTGGLAPDERIWLHRRLFDGPPFDHGDPDVDRRYRDAVRWAVRLIERLRRLEAAVGIEILRRFHAAGAAGKLELIERLTA
jgi:hypothetical protein